MEGKVEWNPGWQPLRLHDEKCPEAQDSPREHLLDNQDDSSLPASLDSESTEFPDRFYFSLRFSPWRLQTRYEGPNRGFVTLLKWIGRLYFVMFAVMFVVLFIRSLWWSVDRVQWRRVQNGKVETRTPELDLPEEVQRTWGAYTPFMPAADYVDPPAGCEVTQVHILQRHGARYPTAKMTKNIAKAVRKLQVADKYLDPSLEFLEDFEYPLGADLLVPFGAAQSYDSGVVAYRRYKDLFKKTKKSKRLPFVRTSGQQRVVESAGNWTEGFRDASHKKLSPPVSVILSEDVGVNNTLNNYCPNIGSSDPQTDQWQNIYATPIAERLNALAPGANLNPKDITNLIASCAFLTVDRAKKSEMCGVFELAELQGFEYFQDVDKYWSNGDGQPLGPVEGVGYINELLARLTNTPVSDTTQTNRTLDTSPETFPYDRPLYVDFSHDHHMIAIYSAMGVMEHDPLDPTGPAGNHSWVTSRFMGFSARMVVEKLECTVAKKGDADEERTWKVTRGKKGKKGKTVEKLRILLNDEVHDIAFCGGDKHGLCTLEDFVESQAYARNNGEGDWEKCFD